MSAYDVKREIEMHQQEKERLEADIPSSITIGPFWINCDTVRNFLVKKRRELAKAVLELLAKKLRTQTEEVSWAVFYTTNWKKVKTLMVGIFLVLTSELLCNYVIM